MVRRAAVLPVMVVAAMPFVFAQQPTFRSGVEIVALNVSVTDPSRQFIRGLGAEDFTVFEDGVRREVTFFGADAVPIDAGLLLDVSGSMRAQMALVAKAAVGFIRTLRRTDRVAVMGFADRLRVLQGLTGDVAQSERAVPKDAPGWGSRFRQLLVRVATRPDAIIRTRRRYDPAGTGRR